MRLPTFFTADPPTLTRRRVTLAYATAIATDALQFILGPFGWAGADEILDVAATALIWRILGFHPLLLPTFLVELLPVSDMLPTWTGCVALVVGLRRRQQPDPPPPGAKGRSSTSDRSDRRACRLRAQPARVTYGSDFR